MRALALAFVFLTALPGRVARAQELPEPPRPAVDPPEEGEDTLSDAEVIRWASRELARADGRAGGRPLGPVPPGHYLAGDEPAGPIYLAGEDQRTLLRLLAEIGGGALGAALGGGAGALLVWAAFEERADPDVLVVAVGAGVVLGSLGISGGVALAADLTGGRGNFGHAFLGQMIGGVLALPLITLGFANDAPELALLAAGLLPLAGAILGYEVGHGDGGYGGTTMAYLTPTRGGVVGGVAGALP